MTAYVGLAALSGHLSPLARGPLLDGIGPPQDYRWVSPPPDLAATNQPPSSGVFPIPLDPNGSRPATPVTSDNQVTVIVPQGAFAKKAGQIEVSLKIDPVDPATLGSPGAGVTIFGNAYRLDATYQPSGDRAKLVLPLDAVLIYPVTPNLHASVHQLYHVAGRADVDGAGGLRFAGAATGGGTRAGARLRHGDGRSGSRRPSRRPEVRAARRTRRSS